MQFSHMEMGMYVNNAYSWPNSYLKSVLMHLLQKIYKYKLWNQI